MIKVDTTSLKQFMKNALRKTEKVRNEMRRELDEFGRDVKKTAKTNQILKNKTGRIYRVYTGVGGRKLQSVRLHRASAPNEHPAVRSGLLWKSMYYKVISYNSVAIGNTAPYAKYLEFGTKKMGARKLVRRTILDQRKIFMSKARNRMYKLIKQ
jgi:HK97 gp10 family phage protein